MITTQRASRGPMTRRGMATRERILDAAADLMSSRGAAGTSLDDVRASTATSKSQLYHYFRDKDDLVRAVIGRQTDRVLEAQRPELEALDSFAALARWRDRVVSLQHAAGCVGGCPVGSLASELADSNEATREDLTSAFARWESYLVEGFSAMRERGRLRADASPPDLATAVIAALEGGLLLTQINRSTRPLELALDMALAHVHSYAPSRSGRSLHVRA
jgi:TetR/AcrR family transcriptional regulator, transcriptional repressor for nem operon